MPAYAGDYYRTSEPNHCLPAAAGYFPDSVVTALGFRQYAAVGFYPTHVLLELK